MGRLKNDQNRDKKEARKAAKENRKNAKLELEGVLDFPAHSWIALALFGSVYLKCTAPSITGGDAGDFILASHHFGVAHPPGYPLYVTLGYFWIKVFPFGTPAYKMNLLTSCIGTVAAFMVYNTTFKITKFVPSAILASSLFAFSLPTWFHSVGAEIFALNNLLCCLLLYWVVRFHQAPVVHRARVAMEASFISGLCICNQHTSVFFIAVIGAWMFFSLLQDKAITVKQFIQTGLAFAVGLVPYLQLPISSFFAAPPSTWGDHRSLAGIWTHFTRREYGTFSLTQSDDPALFSVNLRFYLKDLKRDFGLVTIALCCLCILIARHNESVKPIIRVYCTTILIYVGYFCHQANIDLTKKLFQGVLERFWVQPNMVVSILAGCGLWCLFCKLKEKFASFENNIFAGFTAISIILSGLQLVTNFPACNMSNNYVIRDYALEPLKSVPSNSVLLVVGDMSTFTVRYLRYSENHRQDVDVLCQTLMGNVWYKEMQSRSEGLYKHFIYPYNGDILHDKVLTIEADGFSTYTMKDVFDVHRKAGKTVSIFPNIDKAFEAWKDHYLLVPNEKLVYEVRSINDTLSLEEYIEHEIEGKNIEIDTHICDSSRYPERSWEYITTTEVCNNMLFYRTRHAYKLLLANNGSLPCKGSLAAGYFKTTTLQRLYNTYKRTYDYLMQSDGTHELWSPSEDVQYGLVAHTLYCNYLSTDDTLTAGKYAKTMVKHWQAYLQTLGGMDNYNMLPVLKQTKKDFPDLLTNEMYNF